MSEVKIYIQGDLITQFKDEGINIKSSTQNINDISKVFADFTKDFNVPASKENNKTFKHYYNADITGGFDARTKKDAEIYLNDLLYKKGTIRLVSTSLKDNLIESYKIQFESEVVKIKDLLGDDKLSDLDFSAFDHEYTSANIKQGLETSLSSGAVVYPTISPVKRFVYDSDDNIVNTNKLANIHYNGSKVNNSIDYTDLKPAIRVSEVIEAIQTKYNLTFVGDIFTRDYFTNLYLWLNKEEGNLKVTASNSSTLIDFDGGSTEWIDLATDIFTIEYDNAVSYTQFDNIVLTNTINIDNAYLSIPYNYVAELNGVEIYRQNNNTGDKIISISLDRFTKPNGEVKFYIETEQSIEYDCSLEQIRTQFISFPTNSVVTTEITTASTSLITANVDMSAQIPDFKTYDFIVGIIKMFNIALTGNFDGSINFDTLPEWYAKGKVYKNFDKYIDIDSLTISRGKLNNEFKFNYEKPETLLAKQFKDNTGVAYGDLEAKLFDDDGKLLDGSKLEIKVPFENMIYERLTDEANNNAINFQYGYAVDKEQNPTVTKPILFYNNNTNASQIGFKNDDNTVTELNSTINIPNHALSLTDNTGQTLNFGAEISTYNYGLMSESLYNSFYKDYVTDMFSNQRRVYNFDAVIPNHILTDIALNDRLIIGNKRYIINEISSNLITKKTKLELLNDIYTAGELIGDRFLTNPQSANIAYNPNTHSFTVYSKGAFTVTVEDVGDGIFTTLIDNSGTGGIKTIQYSVTENVSNTFRVQKLVVSQAGYTDLEFYITQNEIENLILWDTTTQSFDSNNITFDLE